VFLFFCGNTYYAGGGGKDFISDFDTEEEALRHAKCVFEERYRPNWGHILDVKSRRLIDLWGYAFSDIDEDRFNLTIENLEWDKLD
jgi:hypothetical protein